MYRFAYALLFAVFVASPASAQVQQVMGHTTCSPRFECSSLNQSTGMSSEKLHDLATRCAKNAFGGFSSDTIFDPPSYISAGQCLTPTSNRVVGNATLTPHCCVVEKTDGECALECTLDYQG